ncbi:hypothetical protein J7481_23235 [Labrenzia sp. R4_2]|jgi:hypothetical protein|uniref:hypothetical protein n=1 Tax=Labrenzia sp. R4_2 TaxID=2821107 RepID=UPI001ADA4DB2|nr:hypothetical protein [Labrenzia sp. R4_2]MBO9422444.1 hypothetical protein [Labrenzia sp. R4_2]
MALIPIPVRSYLPVMLEKKRANVIVRATRIERFAEGRKTACGKEKAPLRRVEC